MDTGLFSHRECTQHEMGSWHPECPERLAAIQDHLIAMGIDPHLVHLEAPLATPAAVRRAHAPDYLDQLQARIPEQGYVALDPDTRMNPATWRAALRAARHVAGFIRVSGSSAT